MDTFSIPLNEGKITGKSRLNFNTFVDLLDSNVRYSLALNLLRSLGIKPFLDENNNIEFLVSSPPLFSNFKGWLEEKIKYEKRKDITIIQSQNKVSSIVAETV